MRRVRLPELSLRLRAEPEDLRGQAGAPPLLCLHGAGMSSVVFMDLVRRLAPRVAVIAPDLPGHGQSGPALPQPSIDGYRDVVLALLDRLAIPRVILAGHSMGGAIALSLALKAPRRVAGLCLLNSAARMRVSAALLETLERELPPDPPEPAEEGDALVLRRPSADADAQSSHVAGVSDAMAESMAALSFSPQTPIELRERWRAVLSGAPKSVVLGDFRACDGFDVRPALAALPPIQSLVVTGADDLLVPARLGEEAARLLPPGAQLLSAPRTGHLSHLEAPELVQDALFALADRVAEQEAALAS